MSDRSKETMESLIDLAEYIGFDAIDKEIDVWIEVGEFDEAVKARAKELGWIPPDTPYSELDRPLF